MRRPAPTTATRFPAALAATLLTMTAARAALAGPDPEWVRITTAHTPGARASAAAAYDYRGRRLLIFGGYGSGVTPRNDVWQLSLDGTPDWTQIAANGDTTGPQARFDASAVYDPVHNQLVVFGGISGNTMLGDVWVLSLGGTPTWRKVDDKVSNFVCNTTTHWSKPCPRFGHSAIWNPAQGKMWITCGEACLERHDTWAASVTDTSNSWADLSGDSRCGVFDYSETLPDFRTNQTLIYDSRNAQVVVCGGDYGGQGLPSNAWITSAGNSWTEVAQTVPGPERSGHTAVYDSVRARMVVYGGFDVNGNGNDSTLVLDLTPGHTPTWSTLHTCGTTPGQISEHVAIFDPIDDRMILYDTSDRTWALKFTPTAPGAITDLNPKSVGGSSIYLRWTAPGGDTSACARPSSYDLRYSTSEITDDATFAAATQVSGEPNPSPAGSKDSLNVGGLSQGTNYWFAIKTSNQVGETSQLSNVLQICWYVNPPRICDGGGLQMVPTREETPQAYLLGIQGIQPNPAHGVIDVAFTLPRTGDATISLFDVAGRLVRREEVGSMGAGAHRVRFGDDAPIPPGFLAVRLSQRGVTVTRSVIVVR